MVKRLKRLVIRAIAATAAGVAAEVMRSIVKPAKLKGREVAQHAPEAEEWMQTVTHRAMEWMRDSDAPDAVRKFCSRVLNTVEPAGKGKGTPKIIDVGRNRAKRFGRR